MMYRISGNTWPVRAQLKQLGGLWNPRAKAWNIPGSALDDACAVLAHFERDLTLLPGYTPKYPGPFLNFWVRPLPDEVPDPVGS